MGFDWKPQKKQEEFLKNDAYEVLFGGAKGPGKTDSLLAEACRQHKNPNYRAVIFRRTNPRLAEIIDRSKRWFMGWGRFNTQSNTWTFPHPDDNRLDGWKLKLAHCEHEDDKWIYHGHEYHFMGFDQIEEFTQTQYLFLMAQNRSSQKGVKCYIRCTANPGNIGHAWVKKRFIDTCPNDGTICHFQQVEEPDGSLREVQVDAENSQTMSRAFIFSTVYDNEILLKNDPNYIKRLKMLPEKERKMLLAGDWDVFSGQYFTEWADTKHVVAKAISPEMAHFISLDYGFAKPASVGFWCVMPDKHLHRFKEIYVEKMRYDALAVLIKSHLGHIKYDYLVADPAIWGDKAHHRKGFEGESGAEVMQDILEDIPIIRGDNRRIIGWGRMRMLFEHGLISCHPNCRDSIRTIPQLIHDDKLSDDLNTRGEDHAADEWRYGAMSRPMPKVSEEKADYDIVVGNNTGINIKWKTKEQEHSEWKKKMIADTFKNRHVGNGTIDGYLGDQW